VLEREGNYHQVYGSYLRRSLDVFQEESGEKINFQLDGYDVRFKEEYPNLDDYDGIVITGSGSSTSDSSYGGHSRSAAAASAYERIPWIEKLVGFMSSALKTHPHINVIAICFGHQIVARALGGECTYNGGQWEAGIYAIDLNDTGKQLFGANTIVRTLLLSLAPFRSSPFPEHPTNAPGSRTDPTRQFQRISYPTTRIYVLNSQSRLRPLSAR